MQPSWWKLICHALLLFEYDPVANSEWDWDMSQVHVRSHLTCHDNFTFVDTIIFAWVVTILNALYIHLKQSHLAGQGFIVKTNSHYSKPEQGFVREVKG